MTELAAPPLSRATLWDAYAAHMLRLHDRPTLRGWATPHGYAILTGEPAMDGNVCSLHADAGAADARELVARIDAAGVPAVIAVSQDVVDPAASAVLRDAGFTMLPMEVAMWRPAGPVPPRDHPFLVRRATADPADVARVARIVTEAHGAAPDAVERVYNVAALADGDVRCWLALDDGATDDAASTAWVCSGAGVASVHEMMTSPRHRRRGAGRAILEAALTEVAGDAPHGTILWASPLGRPLYESIGFMPFDDVRPWMRGATAEELALIGVVMPDAGPEPGS